MPTDHVYKLTIRDDTAEQTVCDLTFEASRSTLVALLRLIMESSENAPTVSVFEEGEDGA